ncbi:MAG: glycosyltransferase family 4 protein [Armatimonadetes bacterium]|nr:glycosyltransferase family 4 protein [Armatimonadota bacterium]
MRRVTMDGRLFLGGGTGVQTYGLELLFALQKLGVEVSLSVAARDEAKVRALLTPALAAAEPPVPVYWSRVSNALLYSNPALAAWRRWPRALPPPRWLPPEVELYHALLWPLPLAPHVPSVLTVHDLLALQAPELSPGRDCELMHRAIVALAPRFDHIITDSDATRQALLARSRVREEQVTTIYPGVSQRFSTPVPAARRAEVAARHGLERPYLVALATVEPRKNLARVIDAYDTFCGQQGNGFDLVLIGPRGAAHAELDERLARARPGRVASLGYLPSDDLPPLLQGAAGLLFPSLLEGFGLPALEAMAAGCPVITANTTSLPEVAGDAALLVDPTDTAAIASAITRVLTEPGLANELRARGRARAAEFAWERTAQATLAVYEQVAARARG